MGNEDCWQRIKLVWNFDPDGRTQQRRMAMYLGAHQSNNRRLCEAWYQKQEIFCVLSTDDIYFGLFEFLFTKIVHIPFVTHRASSSKVKSIDPTFVILVPLVCTHQKLSLTKLVPRAIPALLVGATPLVQQATPTKEHDQEE